MTRRAKCSSLWNAGEKEGPEQSEGSDERSELISRCTLKIEYENDETIGIRYVIGNGLTKSETPNRTRVEGLS